MTLQYFLDDHNILIADTAAINWTTSRSGLVVHDKSFLYVDSLSRFWIVPDGYNPYDFFQQC